MKAIPPNVSPGPDEPNKPLSPINPRKEPLTPDKFRELTGNPSLTDEEANSRIETTRKLVRILLEFSRLTNHLIDNQQVVYLNTTQPPDPSIKQIPPITKTKSA